MLELFGWKYRIEDTQGLASWALGMAWRRNVLYPAKRHEFVISPAGCVFHICEKPSYGLTDFFVYVRCANIYWVPTTDMQDFI